MNSLIVQKYGGNCLASADNIQQVATQVAKRYQQGHALIVVVSAMGSTTDKLIQLAYQISRTPNRREMDMLLTTGERISMALLSMALTDLGCPAISFTGSQAGIMTDASHSSARITDVRPYRLEQCLRQQQIVVLAGFQGVDPEHKEVTTLGRGGSDTTAVAMASYFGARRCEILKDVSGVYSADPRIAPESKAYKEFSYDDLATMSFWGGQVLHPRAVELAKKRSVPLFIGSAANPSQGTVIHHEVNMYEQKQVLAVTAHKKVRALQVATRDISDGCKRLEDFLSSHQLPWPRILTAENNENHCSFTVSGDAELLEAIQQAAEHNDAVTVHPMAHSSVTVTCHGASDSGLLNRILSQLSAAQISVKKTLMGPQSITVLIDEDLREKAVQSLHELVSR